MPVYAGIIAANSFFPFIEGRGRSRFSSWVQDPSFGCRKSIRPFERAEKPSLGFDKYRGGEAPGTQPETLRQNKCDP
jgi:hypothetical protein